MKKIILLALIALGSGLISYATTYMRAKTTDGKIVRYDIASVKEVEIVKDVVYVNTEEKDFCFATHVSNVSQIDFYNDETLDTTQLKHEYVDLGLPSGTLWATYNIGATRPEEFGDYFAWGETEPKNQYDLKTYKWASNTIDGDDIDSFTKYNDSDSVILPEDDAATANWGDKWRMPSLWQFSELIEECNLSWTEINGIKGVNFIAKNGNSIFFPTSGYKIGENLKEVGQSGCFWSCNLSKYPYSLQITEGKDFAYEAGTDRYIGFNVRAVICQE